MKLTKNEVEIMVEVRALLRKRYAAGDESRPYICWTIAEVVRGEDCSDSGFSLEGQMRSLGGDAERLYRKITWALGGGLPGGFGPRSMRNYLESQLFHFGPAFLAHAFKFQHEARLSWLDRIIEMEEIK